VNVLDLRGHGLSLPADLSTVTMEDYLQDIESVTSQIAAARGAHPVLGGWSLGAMLAMMHAARDSDTPALLLIEPPPPLELGGRAVQEQVRRFAGGVLGPEALGIFPDDAQRSRQALFDLDEDEVTSFLRASDGAQESGLALRQSLRGISIPAGSIRCPALVVYGNSEGRDETGAFSRQLAFYLGGESLGVAGAGHWGVVYSQRAITAAAPEVDAWLRRMLSSS
jgi:pimeloyl-ACP methyl ester carboxylesterase